MKLDSKVFRDAANIYLWDGKINRYTRQFSCCGAILYSASSNGSYIFAREHDLFFEENFKPKNKTAREFWWNVGWRFWTQAAVQRHRKKMLLKAADLVDKMNAEEK